MGSAALVLAGGFGNLVQCPSDLAETLTGRRVPQSWLHDDDRLALGASLF